MSAAREKQQADFDLERFIDMFDEALTSNDERVINALRSLMMMVILTKPEGRKDVRIGPLRQLYDDMSQLHRRIDRVEEQYRGAIRGYERSIKEEFDQFDARTAWAQTAAKYPTDLKKLATQINGGLLSKVTKEGE